MSTRNLFGQYYSTTAKKTTYQNVEYVCQSSTTGSNTLEFNDGKVQIVDSNGNVLTSLDLSNSKAEPITEHTTGSIVLNPGEVKLIEGIEYGKVLKETYFQVPNIYLSSLGKKYPYYINVKFRIYFNVALDLKGYSVETVLSLEDPNSDVVSRIQKLLDHIGLEGKVEVSIESIEDDYGNANHYVCFKSLIEGYDFIVTNFVFFNPTIIKSDVKDEFEVSDNLLDNVKEYEDNIVFGDGGTLSQNSIDDDNSTPGSATSSSASSGHNTIGHYDELDDPNSEAHATHYYEASFPISGVYVEDQTEDPVEEEEPIEDPSIDDPSTDIPEEEDDSDIPEEEDDPSINIDPEDEKTLDDLVLQSMEIPVAKDEDLEIPAFLYPNGAARAWFVVPDWPIGIQDDIVSIKLNHVKDHITIFEPDLGNIDDIDVNIGNIDDSDICYKKKEVNVYAGERNEIERHNLQRFKYWTENDAYIDGANGSAIEIVQENCNCNCDCPDLNLEIMNPHIGMYRYLDFVEFTNDWTNVGQFYGLITADDSQNSLIKNLANSIFLYNMNDFPVKVNYLICK